MKWALIIVGGIAALIAIVALIGMLLPRKHVASRTARFRQSPQALWAIVRDLAGAAAWWPGVKKAERLSDMNGHEVVCQTLKDGTPLKLEVVENDPPRRLVTRIANDKLPFGGTWTYEIEPDGDGAKLTITENGEVFNPIFRFVGRFIIGYSGTIDSYFQALGAKCGER